MHLGLHRMRTWVYRCSGLCRSDSEWIDTRDTSRDKNFAGEMCSRLQNPMILVHCFQLTAVVFTSNIVKMYFYSLQNAPEDAEESFVQKSEVIISYTYSYHIKQLMLCQSKYLSLSVYGNVCFISINWVENILLRKKTNSFQELEILWIVMLRVTLLWTNR